MTLLSPFELVQSDTDKDKAGLLKSLGDLELKSENFKRALEYYTESLQCDGSLTEVWSSRCTAYLKLERYQEAYDDAYHVVTLYPTWYEGWIRRAQVLKACGYDCEDDLGHASRLFGRPLNIDSSKQGSFVLNLSYHPPRLTEILYRERHIMDFSAIANLCYVSVTQFMKTFNFEFFPGYTGYFFRLTSSFSFSDADLCRVAKKNPEYNKLDVSGCQNISCDAILFCKEQYLKSLKYVDVRNCGKIRHKEIKLLKDEGIRVIYNVDRVNGEDVYDSQLVIFREDPDGLLDLLQFKNNNNGIEYEKIISQHRRMSLIYHPDLNDGIENPKFSKLNELIDDLVYQLNAINSMHMMGKLPTLFYHGKLIQATTLPLQIKLKE